MTSSVQFLFGKCGGYVKIGKRQRTVDETGSGINEGRLIWSFITVLGKFWSK